MERKILLLPELELQKAQQVLDKLIPNLEGNYLLVGGLPLRFYLSQQGLSWPHPLNDFDFAANNASVLKSSVTSDFHVRHYHQYNNPNFYIQLCPKQPEILSITLDFFYDPFGLESKTVEILNYNFNIPLPEEIYLRTLEDILMLLNRSDNPGLPPKYVDKLRFLISIIDPNKTIQIWKSRNKNLQFFTNKDKLVYEFPSLSKAEEEVKRLLEEKSQEIHPRKKSDPFIPCSECIQDPRFPLLRDQVNH